MASEAPRSNSADSTDQRVRVRGARERNLHDVGVDIPREVFVVFVGV